MAEVVIANKSSVHRKCVGMSPEKRVEAMQVGEERLHISIVGVMYALGKRTDKKFDNTDEFPRGIFEAFSPEGDFVRSNNGHLPASIADPACALFKSLRESDPTAVIQIKMESWLKKTASGRGYEWIDRFIGDDQAPTHLDPLKSLRKELVERDKKSAAKQIEGSKGESVTSDETVTKSERVRQRA